MFAIVSIAGFQEKVAQGDVLDVPTLDAKEGDKLTFKDVLMVSNGKDVKVGAPTVAGASVTAEVVGHGKHDKIRVVKFRRRKRYTRTKGHQQGLTTLKIVTIAA